MWRQFIRSFAIALFVLTLASAASALPAQPASDSQQQVNVMKSLTSMPLTFTENRGQWDEQALFRINAGGATMWFTADGVYYQFVRRAPRPKLSVGSQGVEVDAPIRHRSNEIEHKPDMVEQLVIKASFVGANPSPRIIGENMMEYKCNYFIGNDPNKWHTDVPNYRAIVFENVYSGIDLKYYGNGNQMEYDFIVSPGADVTQITIEYEGIKSLSVNGAGELVVETEWGTVKELTPLVYQVENGCKTVIPSAYRLTSSNTFGYKLGGDYDPNLPLVIDPVLLYSTYLGGSDDDSGWAIAVDANGHAYITGETVSSNFPTENPYQTFQAAEDAFVTKLNVTGNGLIYSTYLGGDGDDWGRGIAVDDIGIAYITGVTTSTNFPTQNPYQTDPDDCGADAFVTKLSPRGNALIYSTYLGGATQNDWGYAIALDDSAHAYVIGYTNAPDFPTQNPYQTFQGVGDAFVTKLNPAGNGLVFSTCLGGSDIDIGWGIAVDANGNAYATGMTYSPNFPTENPYQPDQGDRDAFVTKFNFAGDSLVYSTYLGGGDYDEGKAIAVDASGCAYVTGRASSANFPTENPYQLDQGGADAFVTKLNTTGDGLVYSTYLGGSAWDIGHAIAVDGSGNACVNGWTLSLNFPTQDPYQTDQDESDAFVTKLNAAGNGLVYSTYLGGNGVDYGYAIALDGFNNMYVTGHTESSDFPTENPYQSDQGLADAFVTKIPYGYGTAIEDPQKPMGPKHFALYQNAPNPFNPATVIRYDVPLGGGKVSIKIYDVTGRLVRTLVNSTTSSGHKTITWYGRNNKGQRVPSGVYFYQMTAPDFVKTRKMVLLQ